MKKPVRQVQSVINRKRATTLLFPIAAFFRAAGFNEAQAQDILSAAFRQTSVALGPHRMETIGSPLYGDILESWQRRKKYLDLHGRPRQLPMKGSSGFEALAREAGLNARDALAVLLRYGNVVRMANGKYRLVHSYFVTNTRRLIALEPAASFLSYASDTLSRIFTKGRGAPPGPPGPFWLRVVGHCSTAALENRFRTFAHERGLLFLEELEDWLLAHRSREGVRPRKRRRVGVGLFTIQSNWDGE
jgi:hypothetical protein